MTSSLSNPGASRIAIVCLLAALPLPPWARAAAEARATAAADAPPEPAAAEGFFAFLDRPHDFLTEKFSSLSVKMDKFFADERVFQESRGSYLRFYGDLIFKEAGTSDFQPKLQAKLVLPALERRLKILIESDTDTAAASVPGSTVAVQQGTPNIDVPSDFLAALQMLLTDTRQWNINTDAGIRIHGFALDPFVRARARRVQDAGAWQFRLGESVYWFEQKGAGESTQIDVDRRLSEEFLGRSRTVATWSDNDQRFFYEQSFSLFQKIDAINAMSYQASVFGASQNNTHVTAYAVSAKWRHRLHRDWLFFELQPVLAWPEEEAFHFTPSLLFRVEAIFGDLDCGCYGL